MTKHEAVPGAPAPATSTGHPASHEKDGGKKADHQSHDDAAQKVREHYVDDVPISRPGDRRE
jgi:hypothetical protein